MLSVKLTLFNFCLDGPEKVGHDEDHAKQSHCKIKYSTGLISIGGK